jgi:hypothetical protein
MAMQQQNSHLSSGNQKRFWRTVNAILARSVKRAGRFEATPYGLIVKGKRISCPPHYAPPNNDYDPPHHDYEHGFPLIRSLRASAQRSRSVLFSFVLSLLIVAGSFAVRQSETILADHARGGIRL